MTQDQVAENFPLLADPYRRELLAHCYRMLGSRHDAEDLVQETYLRAWRAYDRFEGRSSLRTWLHKIATTVCLTALEARQRRPTPSGLGGQDADAEDALLERSEVPWSEPTPDVSVDDERADPGAVVASRESTRLALVATLRHLPPRQRAVLLLRDVMRWRAAEVAELLSLTTAAVNSLLQRARVQLERAEPIEDGLVEPSAPEQRELLDRYVRAFESKDVPALVELFIADAVRETSPCTGWYRGSENVGRLVDKRCPAGPDDLRAFPAAADGQPAFVVCTHGANGTLGFPSAGADHDEGRCRGHDGALRRSAGRSAGLAALPVVPVAR